jgi:hypothetical protein
LLRQRVQRARTSEGLQQRGFGEVSVVQRVPRFGSFPTRPLDFLRSKNSERRTRPCQRRIPLRPPTACPISSGTVLTSVRQRDESLSLATLPCFNHERSSPISHVRRRALPSLTVGDQSSREERAIAATSRAYYFVRRKRRSSRTSPCWPSSSSASLLVQRLAHRPDRALPTGEAAAQAFGSGSSPPRFVIAEILRCYCRSRAACCR